MCCNVGRMAVVENSMVSGFLLRQGALILNYHFVLDIVLNNWQSI